MTRPGHFFCGNILIICVIMKIVIGVSPSGKANGSDPFIVGSNPATPASSIHIHNHPLFAKIIDGKFFIEPITPDNRPRSQQELLWRLFVVKSVIHKSELINIKFIKKSCQAYQALNLR